MRVFTQVTQTQHIREIKLIEITWLAYFGQFIVVCGLVQHKILKKFKT